MAPLARAEWITVPEAARELGVSTKTIYRYLRDGLLKGNYVNPRLALIRRAELRKLRRPSRGRPRSRP